MPQENFRLSSSCPCWFHDVQLCEEGRPQLGPTDDYEIYLGEVGKPIAIPIRRATMAMSLAPGIWTRHHATNWITREMCRFVKDVIYKPSFWYCSYPTHIRHWFPRNGTLDVYKDADICDSLPRHGKTSADTMPKWMNNRLIHTDHMTEKQITFARRGLYRRTHIDHQIRSFGDDS